MSRGVGATFGRPRGWGIGHTKKHLMSRVERVAPDPLHKTLAPRAPDLMHTALVPCRLSSSPQDTGDNLPVEAE
eukprot:5619455-Prymnesium_polylepis.1